MRTYQEIDERTLLLHRYGTLNAFLVNLVTVKPWRSTGSAVVIPGS